MGICTDCCYAADNGNNPHPCKGKAWCACQCREVSKNQTVTVVGIESKEEIGAIGNPGPDARV